MERTFLPPIEKPQNDLWLVYYLTKRKFGKSSDTCQRGLSKAYGYIWYVLREMFELDKTKVTKETASLTCHLVLN